ncbi:MAG: DUF5050 domain-containing protein [Clostridiales bacterium]|jgi:hypothetical protein|nr:DUF5050 domain-containing protein [Clostridiales bacterium]
MKLIRIQFLFILTIFILSLCLAGCGKVPLSTDDTLTTPSEPETTVLSTSSITDENANNGRAVLYGDRIYYCYGGIYSINTDGSDNLLLHNDTLYVTKIFITDNRIFYNSYNTTENAIVNCMCSMKLDGSDWQEFDGYNIQGVGTDETGANIVYFNYTSDNGFYCMKPDGSNIKMLSDEYITFVAEVNRQIICMTWDDGVTSNVYIMNLDGTKVQKLGISPRILKFAGERIYYINDDNEGLYSINVDGSDNTKISNIVINDNDFAVTDSNIYYCDNNGDGKLYSTKLDGSDKQSLVNYFVDSIDVAGGRLFYINEEDKALHITKTDGSDPWILDTSIEYGIGTQLNEKMPEYRFVVKGNHYPNNIAITGINVYNETGSTIFSIDFTNSQQTVGYYIPNAAVSDTMGLYVEDVNFDGYKDIILIKSISGAINTTYYYCWLWDTKSSSFIASESFEEIANPTVDGKNHCIVTESSNGAAYSIRYIYNFINGEFVLTNQLNTSILLDGSYNFVEKKLTNGEMETVRDETLPPNTSNPEDAAGYIDDDLWQLNSNRWSGSVIASTDD